MCPTIVNGIILVFTISFCGAFAKIDFGSLRSCDKSLSDFEVKWSPRELKYNEDVTLSGYIIPNLNAEKARACLKVTVDGIEGPIYDKCKDNLSCRKIQKYLPGWCPFKKGVKLETSDVTMKFNPTYQITPGTYNFQLKLYDQLNGGQLLCAVGDITIADDYDDHYDYDDYDYDK